MIVRSLIFTLLNPKEEGTRSVRIYTVRSNLPEMGDNFPHVFLRKPEGR